MFLIFVKVLGLNAAYEEREEAPTFSGENVERALGLAEAPALGHYSYTDFKLCLSIKCQSFWLITV